MLAFVVMVAGCMNRPSVEDDSPESIDAAQRQSGETKKIAPEAPPLPRRSTSPFLNTGADVAYVGSESCRECHADETETFSLTHHARSLSLVGAESQPEGGVVEHGPSQRSYRVESTDKGMVHQESVMREDGTSREIAAYPVKYQVGSGSVARTYLVEDDGFLVESPVTWFTRRGKWEMSPGYESAEQMSFRRVVRSGCLYCHVGHVDNPQRNGFKHHITELSIGCERCHGPGEKHVSQQRNGGGSGSEGDQTIVNPARLSREISEDVCAQCHLHGDVQATVRGRRPDDYRPGLPLSEYRLEFRGAQPDAEMKIAGHMEQLRQSACWQKSPTLTCVTCHDPHSELAPEDRIAKHRATCVECHQDRGCRESATAREAVGNDCLSCHMPQSKTEVTHVALTHHRIGVHRQDSSAGIAEQDTTSVELTPLQPLDFLDEADRNRSQGLAQMTLVRRGGKSEEQVSRLRKAGLLVRKAFESGIRDSETLTALAGLARDMNQADLGMTLAKEALNSDEISPEGRLDALDVLAELSVRSGRIEEAAQCLRAVTQGFRSSLHWFLLGRAEKELGNADAAVRALRQAIKLEPDIVEYRRLLVRILEEANQVEAAERERQLIKD